MENKPPQSVAFLCNASPRWSGRFREALSTIDEFPSFKKEIFPVDRDQPASLESRLSQILARPFDALAVVGGDGTLNRAINFLVQKNALGGMVLAAAPFGTCNDFAKTLGFRAGEIDPVLKALSGGKSRDIRVMRAGRHLFLNNAGFGRRAPEKKTGGPIASLRAMRPVRVRIRNGRELEGDFLMMVCANAPYFSNGLHFERDSDPGDETMDFFFVRAGGKARLFGRLAAGRLGRPLHRPPDDPLVLKVSAERLTIESDDPLWIMADGEIVPDLCAVRRAEFASDGLCRFAVP